MRYLCLVLFDAAPYPARTCLPRLRLPRLARIACRGHCITPCSPTTYTRRILTVPCLLLSSSYEYHRSMQARRLLRTPLPLCRRLGVCPGTLLYDTHTRSLLFFDPLLYRKVTVVILHLKCRTRTYGGNGPTFTVAERSARTHTRTFIYADRRCLPLPCNLASSCFASLACTDRPCFICRVVAFGLCPFAAILCLVPFICGLYLTCPRLIC